MYYFVKKNWASVFPNIEIALQIYLSMMCNNCCGKDRCKVLIMVDFDYILNVFVDNRESDAQLNQLKNIMGTLYKYLIIS